MSNSPAWADTDPQQWQAYGSFSSEATGQWTCVYRSWGTIGELSGAQYSALLPAARVGVALSKPGWEVHIGDGGYGFSQAYENGVPTTTYEQFPEDSELLLISRTFHGIRPGEMELAEEFRFLFNLWEDRSTRTYYYFDESGNAIKAATIEPKRVRILTRLLRRYQAAKQLYLALYIDSTHSSNELPEGREEWKHDDAQTYLEYIRDSRPDLGVDRRLSRLIGKRVLQPPPQEECNFWPFERPARFESFVIGATPDGEEIVNTSEPDELANYFGANPDSPHYLTPVYFRREVLNKYYAEPDRFSVKDGYLSCAGLWGLRLDNDQPDYVMVFLGDLGRDIPYDEARYWRSFNIVPPDEGPSETLVRRAFYAEFTDPKSADLKFANIYSSTNDAWEARFGAQLFLPLHDDDRHVLSKLHIPVGEGQAEFDEQILYLAKLLVDYLNESALAAGMDDAPEKGLAKLQRFLEKQDVEDARTLLRPLADVQGLRSRSAAHRKGSGFDLTVAIGDLGRRDGFAKLLEASMDVLKQLREFAERAPAP